jgi:hypothetical protein
MLSTYSMAFLIEPLHPETHMACRQLRKVEALSSDHQHLYECDSCLWVVHVASHRHSREIEMEFDQHKCEEYPL